MDLFASLFSVISSRRSTKPALMNGKKIDDEVIRQLLALADWAPTHAHTEPWRFIVYSGDGVQMFCRQHAALYRSSVNEQNFNTATHDKLLHNGDKASHVIVAIMKRGDNPKIPALEELSAVSAAIQNILLGAAALGISALWSTGGLTHHALMKDHFKLREADIVMGLLYLGYADEKEKEGVRIMPLQEKVTWIKGNDV